MIKEKIGAVPDWPKKGIIFRDITTLLRDPEGLKATMDDFYARYKDSGVEYIVGIEARGFIMGAILADRMGIGFVPIRKKGKLPPEVIGEEYELEYGTDKIEIKKDAFPKGSKILLIDDLLATGGTALAACSLLDKVGADIHELAFIVDLPDVGGAKKLMDAGIKFYAQCQFEGD